MQESSTHTSEAVTKGIRVAVAAQFSHAEPERNQWLFRYTVRIVNEGVETVQLISRHWIITDGSHAIEEVKGPGVVGSQQILAPGQAFEYTSGCPLPTPFGSMRGSYQMVTSDGTTFDAEIAEFVLSEPYTVH